MKAEGLDRQELNQRLPTSELTLAGLLKHLALVEADWIQVRFCGRPELEPWASAPWEQDRDWEFHTAEHDDPDALRALYHDACARSRSAIAVTDLDTLSVGRDREGRQWSLRWVLTHLIEETARHNGHADLLREAIDRPRTVTEVFLSLGTPGRSGGRRPIERAFAGARSRRMHRSYVSFVSGLPWSHGSSGCSTVAERHSARCSGPPRRRTAARRDDDNRG